jgi:hypothetical protein
MYAFIPFIVLIILLLLTKNNLISIGSALVAASFFYIQQHDISIFCFLNSVLKKEYLSIFTPEANLYPISLLLIISIILTMLEELNILDSYRLLMQKLLLKTNQFLFHILLLSSPFFFFLDDYLSVMGIKGFFSPLLTKAEKNKTELTTYMVFLAGGGSLLCFISTWVTIVVTQINNVKEMIPEWKNLSGLSIFFEAKKYFFYPLILWLYLIAKSFFFKNNFIFAPVERKNDIIPWEDMFIFILLPLGIGSSFLYQSWYLGNSIATMDAGKIMFEGSLLSLFGITCFSLFLKSIKINFLIRAAKKSISELLLPILTLSFCWLFSKLIVLLLDPTSLLIFQYISPAFYPIFYFIIAFFTALILGSEWGTFSIVITFLPLVAHQYSHMSLLLGAIISGTLAGSQTTPLSNIQVTASTVMEVNPLVAYLHRIKETIILILITIMIYLCFGFYIFF